MDKRYSQLELFTAARPQEAVSEEPERRPFIFAVNLYQKRLFLFIGFVVTGLIFYCLGVEHGRARASSRGNAGFDLASGNAPAVAVKQDRQQASPVAGPRQLNSGVQQQTAVEAPAPASVGQRFAVQVASYQAESAAKRERDKLSKSGLPSRIVKKGGYVVLLVGDFGSKETARELLTKLRGKYRDCYIRRL